MLNLLERTDGPLIEDYPEDVGLETDFSGWACPVNLSPAAIDSISSELERLSVWYDRAVQTQRRTTVGVSGLTIAEAGSLVVKALEGPLPPAQLLKEATDDLKAYYLEAAMAFPDSGTASTRKEWLWSETKLAEALLALQPKLLASADSGHRLLGRLTLIPWSELHRLLPARS